MKSKQHLGFDVMSSNSKKILFITTELPFPPTSGGRIKSFRFLKHLACNHEVQLLCAYGHRDKENLEKFKAESGVKHLQVFNNHLPRTPLNFFTALMRFATFNTFRIYSKEIESMVKWSSASADLVIIDHLECFNLLPEKFQGKVIYHSHNAECKLWEDFAKLNVNGFTALLLKLEAKRVKNFERYAISRSNFTFMAPNDRELIMREIGFKETAFRNTFHLGNDELLNAPDIDLHTNKPEVYYAGTLSWEPNRDGLQWFLQKCWPLVLETNSEATLNICGAGADDALKTLMHNTSGVKYHGFVNDLEVVMKISRCAIVPLRFGSGMKIKTFDALYRGLPLVSTSIGAEGIDLVNNVHAAIVDEPGAFAQAVNSFLQNAEISTTIRDSARKLCAERYTYSTLFDQMDTAIEALLDA